MRRLSSSCACVVVTATLISAATSGVFAQGAPGGGPGGFGAASRSGPGPKSAPGFGGTISGRMNLIGPGDAAAATQPSLAAPAPPPAPMFAPERIDQLPPGVLNQLKMPHLTPNPAMRPTTPQTAKPGEAPVEAALPPATVVAPIVKQALQLSAVFDEKGAQIRNGVRWRLFTDQTDANGEHMLVAESTEATPRFSLDPGSYIVHAVYGLVSAAKFVTVKAAQPTSQTLVLPAGAVRLTAFVGGQKAPDDAVTFKLTRDDGGVARTVAENVKSGALMRLPAGSYHIASLYGDANASVDADLQVAPGKLVEAQVHHKAARVSLKLVPSAGAPELRDTSWTILTPGGDVIRDSIGALTGIVLAEGDYTAIARRDGRLFQQSFSVKTGQEAKVEVVAQ